MISIKHVSYKNVIEFSYKVYFGVELIKNILFCMYHIIEYGIILFYILYFNVTLLAL